MPSTPDRAAADVRAATPEDAEALGRVHLRCWHETYPHLLSPSFLAALRVEDRVERWRRLLTGRPGATHAAVVDDEVVGFASTRAGEDGPRALELWGLYLLAAHHGTGLGQRLMTAAVADRPAFLWCAEENPRALAFYARNGFRRDGARRVETDWEDVAVVRLVR